jgi:hypothetical protein
VQALATYPARLDVAYPEMARKRLTAAFRIFVAIPILIVLGAVGGGAVTEFGSDDAAGFGIAGAGGTLVLGPLIMIVFRQKYPLWWFEWNIELSRFSTRVVAFLLLLRDEYPSTDEKQFETVELDYPDVPNTLNRWLPLVKWLLAIPHFVVLFFLGIAVVIVTIIAWFAILFTGRYPAGMFNFVVGVMRWGFRVEAYALLMITDVYPPFSLE